MRITLGVALAVFAVGFAGAARADDGDPAAGKVVFGKCAICHSADTGVNKIGPSLHGVVDRHSASIPTFNYSPAMKAADWDWSADKLNTYLVDPRAVVPGTRMIFPGLKSDTDRANLIAYLKTLS